MTSDRDRLAELRRRLARTLDGIHSAIRMEGDDEWAVGILNLQTIVNDTERNDVAGLRDAVRAYDAMHRGPGGFGDYFVWRESLEERVAANRTLDELRATLSDLIERARAVAIGSPTQ